jgi:hypothetical protein
MFQLILEFSQETLSLTLNLFIFHFLEVLN